MNSNPKTDLNPSNTEADEIERLARIAHDTWQRVSPYRMAWDEISITSRDDSRLMVRAILSAQSPAPRTDVSREQIAKAVLRYRPTGLGGEVEAYQIADAIRPLYAKPVSDGIDPRLATFRAWLRSHVQFSASAGTNARSVYDTIWAKVAEVFGDERKGERRYRDLNEMTKRKKRGPDRRQSTKPEMRKGERRGPLNLDHDLRRRTTNSDRRAPPPIATLEAERARPSREEIAGIIQNAAYREGDYNEPACSWDSAEKATDKILALFPDHSTLEAENKRLKAEVERLERYREESKIWGFYEEEYPIYQIGGSGCELASPMTAEEANELVTTIKNLRAELATLRASPLPVTAEELAAAIRGTSVKHESGLGRMMIDLSADAAAVVAERVLARLPRISASRTEAKPTAVLGMIVNVSP